MLSWHRSNEASSRLAEIPGVGPVIATALVAKVGNASQFASARHFAAWLGLVPRGTGTGGKIRLGSITKRGDGYLRRLLIHGARSVLRWIGNRADASSAWLSRLLDRRPVNVAVTAYAGVDPVRPDTRRVEIGRRYTLWVNDIPGGNAGERSYSPRSIPRSCPVRHERRE